MRSPMDAAAQERIAALESTLVAERSALAQERARVAELTHERDRLRDSHERLRLELELLRRERIGFEESCKLAWKRGGMRRLVIARVKYRAVDAGGESVIETAPMPPECFPRSLAAPSALAHVI